jgi:hypothetical protein
MPTVDIDRLLWIVTGVQLNAEIGDRPLAYRVEREVRKVLRALLGPKPKNQPAPLTPVVVSDVFYLNSEEAQHRPVISIGGPGMNALSAMLVNELPTVAAIEDELIVQMDLEFKDLRCAVWGMSHLDTVRAVEVFLEKGYLETFLRGTTTSGEHG